VFISSGRLTFGAELLLHKLAEATETEDQKIQAA
jgi:hypothetical protein